MIASEKTHEIFLFQNEAGTATSLGFLFKGEAYGDRPTYTLDDQTSSKLTLHVEQPQLPPFSYFRDYLFISAWINIFFIYDIFIY